MLRMLQICYLLSAISTAFTINVLFLTLLVRIAGHLEILTVDMVAIESGGAIATNEAHVVIKNVVDRYNRIRE